MSESYSVINDEGLSGGAASATAPKFTIGLLAVNLFFSIILLGAASGATHENVAAIANAGGFTIAAGTLSIIAVCIGFYLLHSQYDALVLKVFAASAVLMTIFMLVAMSLLAHLIDVGPWKLICEDIGQPDACGTPNLVGLALAFSIFLLILWGGKAYLFGTRAFKA